MIAPNFSRPFAPRAEEIINLLETHIFKGWAINAQADYTNPHTSTEPATDTKLDGQLLLTLGDSSIRLSVETTAGKNLSQKIYQLKSLQEETGTPLLIVADYISSPTRQKIMDLGLNAIDTTGWVHIALRTPPIFISKEGSAKAPKPISQSVKYQSLTGKASGRILTQLYRSTLPVGVRDLAYASGTSPGSVSKLLPLLELEEIAQRDSRSKKITRVNRQQLIGRWAQDYKTWSKPYSYRDPRGMDHARKQLTEAGSVFSGLTAAYTHLPQATIPAVEETQILAYLDDPVRVAKELHLREVPRHKANVLLMPSELILGDPVKRNGLRIVPPAQLLVDLAVQKGRESEILNQLKEFMDEDSQ